MTAFLSLAQGIFYLITGIWPVVSRSTFEKVTGPKVDFWLVRTIGVLIAVVGGVLSLAGLKRQVNDEISLLAVGSAAGLAGSDLVYVSKGRISPVYLLDALAEMVLIALWAFALRKKDI